MGDTSLTMSCNEMSFFPPHFMLQTSHEEDHHHPPNSLNPIFPSCTPQNLHQGVESILGKRCEERNGDDDMSDDGSQAGEKKKRLNMEQVKTLEKNFELGNKLEPERKLQLARALGLQPRQIAIWFQNRRARWKSKQLEIDYDLLKKQFEEIKADNDALQAQNKKLHAEILALKSREPAESINLNKETEASCSNRSENSSDINLDISRTPAIDSPLCLHPSRPSFPTSIRPTSVINAQIQQNSSKTDVQCQKINHTIQDESLCNMFCSIVDQPVDDHPGFWPWSEHQQFH